MMTNLYIDNENALETFGVALWENSFAPFIALPSFKAISVNDWAEFDGVEPDLSAPVLNSRTLKVPFYVREYSLAESLFEQLKDGAYHTFRIPALCNREWVLRLTNNDSFSTTTEDGFAKMELTFSEDNPSVPASAASSIVVSRLQQTGYEIDRINLNERGCLVLQGTDTSIRKAAQVRPALSVSIASVAGVVYDQQLVKYKTKDITLKCLIHAPSVEQFFARYDTIFHDLMQPGERTFYFAPLRSEWSCYYKSMAVSRLIVREDGETWCEFSVTLTTTDYRPANLWALLNAEDEGRVVINVGGVNYHITVRPRRASSSTSNH